MRRWVSILLIALAIALCSFRGWTFAKRFEYAPDGTWQNFNSQEHNDNMWDDDHAKASLGSLQQMIITAEERAIALLRDEGIFKSNPHGAYYAIKYLELIKSKESVAVLCDHLMFQQQTVKYQNALEGASNKLARPATAALATIGTPAVNGLLRKVSTSDTSAEYREVAMWVLNEILRKENILSAIDEFLAMNSNNIDERQRERMFVFIREFRALYLKKD